MMNNELPGQDTPKVQAPKMITGWQAVAVTFSVVTQGIRKNMQWVCVAQDTRLAVAQFQIEHQQFIQDPALQFRQGPVQIIPVNKVLANLS